jgi:hypothetical protein
MTRDMLTRDEARRIVAKVDFPVRALARFRVFGLVRGSEVLFGEVQPAPRHLEQRDSVCLVAGRFGQQQTFSSEFLVVI